MKSAVERMRLGALALVASVFLVGCATNRTVRVPAGSETCIVEQGEEVEIVYRWGSRHRNRIDTSAGTITKDLISDGTVTVPFKLSLDQKRMVAQFADSIGFWMLPDQITPPDTLEMMGMKVPYHEHLLVIWDKHRLKAVMWDTQVVDPIAERDRVGPLGDMIKQFVLESEEYQALPKASGGYW